MVKPKTFGTVCSGIGAPEVAVRELGWKPVFSSEIEAFPNAVRDHHFSGVPNFGDMTKYEKWPRANIDVLIGGTPCQSFSVAGLRAGMADPRGNLALTFLGIVDKYAPTWVLWENVPGVHSSWSDVQAFKASEESYEPVKEAIEACRKLGIKLGTGFGIGEFEEVDQANDFDCFIAGLEQLGYGVAATILDAQYFGVAQRRRHVFVVGHIGGLWQRAAAVLFDRESLCGNPAPRRTARQTTAHSVAPSIGASGRGFDRAGETRGQDPVIASTLNSPKSGGRRSGTDVDTCESLQPVAIGIDSENNATEELSGTLNHLSPSGGGHPATVAIGIDGGELAYALRSNPSHSGDKGDGGVNTTLVAATLRSCSKTERGHSARAGDKDENLVVHALKGEGFDASEDGTGRGTPIVAEVHPCLKSNKDSNSDPAMQARNLVAETVGTLTADTHPGSYTGQDAYTGRLIASAVEVPESSNTICARDHKGSTPEAGQGSPLKPVKVHPCCRSIDKSGRDGHSASRTAMAVRRLTPRECERLQGFPDDFTLVQYRGKPAKDGPRYKALGNSMAVPVIRWICSRMDLVDELVPLKIS